jgi:hypothetical protein
MTEDTKQPRRRRTPEELRAFYEQKIKNVEDGERREVIRLLSGVHDDLQKASTYKPGRILQVTEATKEILSALKFLEESR